MCQIFAGQNPENYSCVTRSIRLEGQVTSIRLEGLYWSLLDDVAESQGFTTPAFIAKLHREVTQLRGAPKNFTSMLRSACLIYLDAELASRLSDRKEPSKKAG